MSGEIVQLGKRKFIIWIVGNFTLGILVGFGWIEGPEFVEAFQVLNWAVLVGYAAEYFGKK